MKTSDLEPIVRLYHAEEIETTANLTIGSSVRIKVGRWQGQTATICEVQMGFNLAVLDA